MGPAQVIAAAMDVTIVEAANVPSKPVVALHVGTVRRQVRMEVNRTFQVPHPGSEAAVQMTLFQQITSQALLLDDGEKESMCSIKVPGATGEASGSEVQLRVRRCDPSSYGKSPICDKLEDAREYLVKHQLQQRIQSLIQDVLKAQPDDPYGFMLQSLKKDKLKPESCKQEIGEASAAIKEAEKPQASPPPVRESLKEAAEAKAEPRMVPKPPECPKPVNDSPRKVGSFKATSQEAAPPPSVPAAEAKAPVEEEAKSSALVGREDARSEARKVARASIGMVMMAPRITDQAWASLREKVQAETSSAIAASAVAVSSQAVIDKVQRCQDPKYQARASILLVLQNLAPFTTREHHLALTRYATNSLIRAASSCISRGDAQRRQECFTKASEHPDDSGNLSVPKPIVSLASEGGSWGSWLGATSTPSTPKPCSSPVRVV